MSKAAGLVFVPRAADKAACARRLLATSLAAWGFDLASWASVPLGDTLTKRLFHVTVTPRLTIGTSEAEQRLDKARRETEERATAYGLEGFRIAF